MYVDTVKVRATSGAINEYIRVIEAYRHNSKIRQCMVADLGRKDLLVEMLAKLQRLLSGDADVATIMPDDAQMIDGSLLLICRQVPVHQPSNPLRRRDVHHVERELHSA